MARPPTDPNPVASTGGAANVQGQAIFTGDWNALVADYISQTDSTIQTIASALGLGMLGSNAKDVLQISPPTGFLPATPGTILDVNPNSFSMPTSGYTFRL